MSNWFEIDRGGLRSQLERRGIAWAVFELVQNAWDSGTDRVSVRLEPVHGKAQAMLVVEDWSESGFVNIDHAYTMFARSSSASDPEKRGRFNLGEKMVLSICTEAVIETTTGTLVFNESGRRRSKKRRDAGTRFSGLIRMTRDQMQEVEAAMFSLIPPVPTTFNGEAITKHKPMTVFEVTLPTEFANEEGQLRKTRRKCVVEVYDHGGMLCELGIPVVESDTEFGINVMQKVPLNTDRDNVPPAFLREVRTAVLNHVYDKIEDASAPWVTEAASDSRARVEAVVSVVRDRFGDRAVAMTPGDPHANAQAKAAGYTVVPGGSMPSGMWANARKADGLVPSASKLFPSQTAEQREQQIDSGVCPLCGKAKQ